MNKIIAVHLKVGIKANTRWQNDMQVEREKREHVYLYLQPFAHTHINGQIFIHKNLQAKTNS